MWEREQSKRWIKKTCGEGWLFLVDEVYDKLPNHLNIKQAYSKWGLLKFDIDKHDECFEEFLESIEYRSGKICEKCGGIGSEVNVNRWIYTRCEVHSK